MSSSILDMLTQQLGGDVISQISRQLGSDEKSTESALGAAVPVLVSALAGKTRDEAGARSLSNALERDHDGSILDNLPGFLEGFTGGGASSKRDDGAGILGHVLGGRRSNVESGVAKASGLDLGKVGGLLEMLAPMVMGAAGKAKRDGGFDIGGLAEALGKERGRVEQQAPEAKSMLEQLLDRDGDGSVADDVIGMLGGFLGRK